MDQGTPGLGGVGRMGKVGQGSSLWGRVRWGGTEWVRVRQGRVAGGQDTAAPSGVDRTSSLLQKDSEKGGLGPTRFCVLLHVGAFTCKL